MSRPENDRVKAYLDAVCAEIRWTEAHPEIRQELATHIADRAEAALEAGLSEQDALDQALRQMGDPTLVGSQLNQAHRPRIEWGLLGATLLLVLLGLWAMHAVEASGTSPAGGGLLAKKLLWSAIGLAVAAGVMFFDYRRLRRFAWPWFGLILLAIGWAGSEGWRYGGFPQFLSLAPLLLAPALAGIFAGWSWTARWAWMKAAALIVLPTLALLRAPAYFPVLEYVVLFTVTALGTRPPWRKLLGLAPVALAVVGMGLGTILRYEFRRARLFTWLAMHEDPLGQGYQAAQSLDSLRRAGPWGHGLTAPLSTLPEIHTDFVFPYLVYTLGWVAGAAICLVLVYFVLRMARLARHIRDPFGALLVRVALALFALEIGWNLLMTFGLVPIVGVDLPFVSHGGREVIYLAVVGLVLSIFRRKGFVPR